MKRLAWVLGLAWLAAPAAAFNLERYRDSASGKWYPVRWAPGTRTIPFEVNDEPLQVLSNIVGDSALLPTIQSALQAWAFAPISLQVQGTTATASWALDGVNLISFANTVQNRGIINQNEALGATLRWGTLANRSYWRIAEVDIILDPRVMFAADGRAGVYDLQGVLTHELGHALGLSHSPVASSVMWTYTIPGQTGGRFIDPDDMNAVNALYGDPSDPRFGSLAGDVVTGSGAPVFGAHVVATGSDGIVRGSAFTDKDGSFTLPLLPPDRYIVYVEPINREHTTGEFSYDYYHAAQRNFHSTFVGGNPLQPIAVSAGQAITLDPIQVAGPAPQVDVEYLGTSMNATDYSNLNAGAVPLAPGAYTNLLVVGHGLSGDTRIQASGPDVTFDTNHMSAFPWSNGFSTLTVPIAVRNGAPAGGRNLYVYQDGEVAAYIGGIKVVPP